MAGRQSQAPADFAGQVGQGAASVVQHIEDLIGTGQQGASGLCQADLTAQPIEQAHLQLLLKAGNALADRRLRQVQALSGPGEAAGFGDGNKGIEVGQVHSGIPVGYPKHKKYEFELFNVTP